MILWLKSHPPIPTPEGVGFRGEKSCKQLYPGRQKERLPIKPGQITTVHTAIPSKAGR